MARWIPPPWCARREMAKKRPDHPCSGRPYCASNPKCSNNYYIHASTVCYKQAPLGLPASPGASTCGVWRRLGWMLGHAGEKVILVREETAGRHPWIFRSAGNLTSRGGKPPTAAVKVARGMGQTLQQERHSGWMWNSDRPPSVRRRLARRRRLYYHRRRKPIVYQASSQP